MHYSKVMGPGCTLSRVLRLLLAMAALMAISFAPQSASGQASARFDKSAIVNFTELANQPGANIVATNKVVPSPRGQRMTGSSFSPLRTQKSAFPGVQSHLSVPALGILSPPPTLSFQAGNDQLTEIPPDTMGAVGPNHLFVVHNSLVRIQDKTGRRISSVSLDQFWKNLGPFVSGTFDPKAYFDPYSGHFLFVTMADGFSPTSAILVAESQTSDPTGNWFQYKILADPTGVDWADYPSAGYNKDWFVVTANYFQNVGGSFDSANVFIFSKTNLLAGGATASFTQKTLRGGQFTLSPAVTLDPSLSTIYLVENPSTSFTVNSLNLYTITGPVGQESLNFVGSVNTPNSWDAAPFVDAPQAGTFFGIDPGDARMQNVVYRNGTIWACHSVFLPVGIDDRSAVQWFQLDTFGNILQTGRIDDPTGATWYDYGTIAVNRRNDAMIGYSVFSASTFASAAYSLRLGTDPVNTFEAPNIFRTGLGPYIKTFGGGRNRWGDYSMTVVDPVNDLTFWTIQEYADTPVNPATLDGNGRWATWWASLTQNVNPTGFLSVNVIPIAGTILPAGQTIPFFVSVDDGVAVTNATVSATIPGLFTNVVFANDGLPPDTIANDDIYAANLSMPTQSTNITMMLVITAPGKFNFTNFYNYQVVSAPGNDFFINAFKIPDQGGIILGNNTFATIEPNEPVHANVASVANSVWWNFAPKQSGPVLIDSQGSAFSTVLAVYSGNSIGNLTNLASAAGTGNRTQGYLTFNATAGNTYRVAVAGFALNDFGKIRLRVEFNGVPDTNAPTVAITSPSSGLITTNGTITVTGTASDTGPGNSASGVQSVVIAVNGNPPMIATGTNNWTAQVTLQPGTNLVQVTAVDAANNSSKPAKISINYRLISPPNDIFAAALPLAGASGVIISTNTLATFEAGEPLHAGKMGGKSIWFSYTPPADGLLVLNTTNSTFDTLLAMYTGTRVNQLTPIASNDDEDPINNIVTSKIVQAVSANQTYMIAVDGLAGASGLVELHYDFAPATIYTVTVNVSGNGTVSPVTGVFTNGAVVQFAATPGLNQDFVAWSGNYLATDSPLTVNVLSNMTLNASFQAHNFIDDFETGNLSRQPWVTNGASAWFVQVTNSTYTNTSVGGKYMARSGPLLDSQSNSLSLTLNLQAGQGAFWYRVSSEPAFGADGDYFDFFLNGTNLVHAAGESGWVYFTFPVAAGSNTLNFSYTKDAAFSENLDAAFIDNLELPLAVTKNSTTPAQISAQRLVGSNPQIFMQGQTNQVYVVQSSLDLFNWVPVSTNTAVHGVIEFTDPNVFTATNSGAVFYRIASP